MLDGSEAPDGEGQALAPTAAAALAELLFMEVKRNFPRVT
jgi:hypothetical protein